MDIGIVSMRYAKALMEYAKSMGAEDTLYKEFCMLDRSFRKHPDLRMALENPILTIREKLTLICTAAVGDAPAGREFARFMTLVLKNRRENFLQYICLSFLDLYRKDKHIGVGKLITAVPVSQEVREYILEVFHISIVIIIRQSRNCNLKNSRKHLLGNAIYLC